MSNPGLIHSGPSGYFTVHYVHTEYIYDIQPSVTTVDLIDRSADCSLIHRPVNLSSPLLHFLSAFSV